MFKQSATLRGKSSTALSSTCQSGWRQRLTNSLWSTGLGLLLTGLALVAPGDATAGAHQTGGGTIRVATYNQYFGADLVPLVTASADTFNATLLGVLKQIADNHFRARAWRQAGLIAREAPDLVGLQEVWEIACQELPPTAGACSEPLVRPALVDQLSITLLALAAHGAPYRLAAQVKNFDTAEIAVPVPGGGTIHGLPFTVNGKNGVLLARDRDVILSRAGVATQPVAFPGCEASFDGCNYATRLTLSLAALPGVSVEFKRGFVGVDAIVRGRARRLITTHLEIQQPQPGNPLSMVFQSAQAAELIGQLGAIPLPASSKLVLVGDLNSAPTDVSPATGIVPPYQQLLAAHYRDIWVDRHGGVIGATCCQDADLRNPASKLTDRIDHVFVATPPALVLRAERIGENVADKTRSWPGWPALWPSDHAGVVTSVRF